MPRTYFVALALTAAIVCGAAARSQEAKPQAVPQALPLAWQQLASQPLPNLPRLLTFRTRVPGGWLIAVVGQMEQPGESTQIRPGEIPVGATFLPDPEHRWDARLER